MTKDMKKVKVPSLSAFFALTLLVRFAFSRPRPVSPLAKVWGNKDLPLMEDNQVSEHINKLDIHKSRGPDGTLPESLRELAGVTVRLLLIIFERSW